MSKCFCHFNGYEVKDAKARTDIETINEKVNELENTKIEVFNNVSEMISSTKIKENMYVETLGYTFQNDNGGAKYLIRTKTENDIEDKGSIHFINESLVAEMIIDNEINVKQFGAIGDGIVDDTIAIQNTINYSCDNNYPKIIVPDGSYLITSTLSTKENFKQPIIEGSNNKTTSFIFNGSDINSILVIKGGSGSICKSYISNISFTGNNTHRGIELQGVCGFNVVKCDFGTLEIGVLFHNSRAGEFTEYDVIEDCEFSETCKIAVTYYVSNGDESFHGSGLKGCLINQSSNDTEAKIVIGERAIIYNSPLDFTIWLRNINTSIIANHGNNKNSFYGKIKIECFATGSYLVLANNSNPLNFAGNILVWGGIVSFKGIEFVKNITINPDGSITKFKDMCNFAIQLENETTDLFTIENGETFIVDIRLNASNYEFHETLIVGGVISSETNTINKLATHEGFDVAGYGVPSYVSNGRTLAISNPNYVNGVTCFVCVTQLSTRASYSMF